MKMLEIGPRSKPALKHYEELHDVVYLDAVDRMGVDVVHAIEYPDSPLPFFDDTFYLVAASHILEHIPYHREEDVFADLHRVLHKDGQLHIAVPDGTWIGEQLVNDRVGGAFKGWMIGGMIDEFDVHVNVFTKASLAARLQYHGFEIVRMEYRELVMTQGGSKVRTREIQAAGVKQ